MTYKASPDRRHKRTAAQSLSSLHDVVTGNALAAADARQPLLRRIDCVLP